MKRWVSLVAFGALTYHSSIGLCTAGDIPLERLVGHYSPEYKGEVTGGDFTISINPDHTLNVYQRSGVTIGLLRDGAVVCKNDGIPRTGPDRKNLPLTIMFYPVCWGDRTYLITAGDMPDFCNRINAGIEPRSGTGGIYFSGFCLKDGDRSKHVSGEPEIPERYKELLLPKPVTGNVVEFVGDKQARINLGSDSGVRLGMTLMLYLSPEKLPRWKGKREFVIRVTEVQKDSSLIEGSSELFNIGDAVTSRRWD